MSSRSFPMPLRSLVSITRPRSELARRCQMLLIAPFAWPGGFDSIRAFLSCLGARAAIFPARLRVRSGQRIAPANRKPLKMRAATKTARVLRMEQARKQVSTVQGKTLRNLEALEYCLDAIRIGNSIVSAG